MIDNGKRRDKIRDPTTENASERDASLDYNAGYGKVGSLTDAIANAVASVSQETRKRSCGVL